MSKKIGRNASCPCGSGKKYKRCCMLVEQSAENLTQQRFAMPMSYGLNAPTMTAYLKHHDAEPLLDYLIALQLNPKNHGKNIRFEHIIQLLVSSLGKSKNLPKFKEFKAIIDKEYPYDAMEDLPCNVFSEQVVFFGGNYQFFPGISTHATELFRAMTEAIYHDSDLFPEAFCKEVCQGVTFMLEFGDMISYRAGIKGLIRGNNSPREKIREPVANHSYAFTELMMSELLKHFGLEREVLTPFLLDAKDPKLMTTDPEENPILYHPIVHYNGGYYFVGITNQGCAINNFILKTATKHGCLKELVHWSHYGVWMRIGSSCVDKMRWNPGLFKDLLVSDALYEEVLFQIDVNWLAYVCYAKDSYNEVTVDGEQRYIHRDMEAHLKRVLATLRNDERTKGYHILNLVLYSSMGGNIAYNIGEQKDADYQLEFSAFDFLQLVQTEKWDNMSLVRFARTKETKQYFKTSFNQLLDIYSVYKQYGESFCFSDDADPYLFTIDPDEGCQIVFDSKEQLNYHGTMMSMEGKYAYIPVQRDIEFENVYEPINKSITAKSCESFSLPVWVRCSQTEMTGINPSSIIDTVITAVAFWMERLKPSIEKRMEESYDNTVELDISFSEDTLTDKGIHYEDLAPTKAGALNVSKTKTGVMVFMDHNFVKSFMGANNSSERLMMQRIVEVLLDMDENQALSIIDERIPAGSAKMILMMELSNNPMSYPLWLKPPIYIHEATHQLLLDEFPLWMKNANHDIEGRLETKQEKEQFLHDGVDVLLKVLAERLKGLDTLWLLKKLISNHDTLIYQREHEKVIQPAQIICFGDNENKRKEFFDTEKRLTDAGLSTRTLIEYLAATQINKGGIIPGSDDIEGLMSIMNHIVVIGGICDAIHLDVSDHIIEKLKSGRYGIYDYDFEDNLSDYASNRSVESVNESVEGFDVKMNRLAAHPRDMAAEQNEIQKKTDEAFIADWGISYSSILQFLYACHLIAMEQQKTVVEISDDELVKKVCGYYKEFAEETALKCLDKLSLDKRASYLEVPEGLTGKDIFPWSYNRELSYLRRPIVRYLNEDRTITCIFGLRSCLLAGVQLTDLLYSGRLKNGGKQLSKLLGYFEKVKGRKFNEEVRAFLQKLPGLKVWPHDISIKQKGNLVADNDYGDIDVMAYDTKRNILYSIECKNTNTAKNIREMKTEMDEYLGRGENPEKDKTKALVLKHLRRHKWLIGNLAQIMSFIGIEKEPMVKSMMLTAAVIPTSYLKKEATPLSILNYRELKQQGIAYLDTSKDPDLSVIE